MNLFLLEPGSPIAPHQGSGTRIVLNRQSDLILDNAKITKPVGIELTDVAGVSDAFDKEASERAADVKALYASIKEEASERAADDKSINQSIADEIAARLCAEHALTDAIDSESIKRQTGDEELAADLKSESMARIKSVKELESNLSNESDKRAAADDSLQKQIDFITSNVDPESIDSLTEVVSAFQSADNDLNGAITDLAAAASKGLREEVERATAAEDKLATSLEETMVDFKRNLSDESAKRAAADKREAEERIAADDKLSKDLTEEIAARLCAEEGLSNDLATTAKNLDAYITKVSKTLESELEKETKTREYFDSMLSDAIDVEHSHHVEAEAKLTAELCVEVGRASSVETVLSDAISVEASNRLAISAIHLARAISAEDSLASEITSAKDATNKDLESEIKRALCVEGGLQSQISQLGSSVDFITSNVDSGAIDSLTEIVKAFQDADGDINNAITKLADSAAADLNKEAAIREKADDELSDSIKSEVKALYASIDKEASERAADDKSINQSIADEIKRALCVEHGLTSDLESEIKRAKEAEASLESALSAEVAYLISNTDLTAIDSFAEVSTALSTQVSDFETIYSKRIGFSGDVDGINSEFTLESAVRLGSEHVYLNGLLLDPAGDYSLHGSTLMFATAPSEGDKVTVYGVPGIVVLS